MKVAEQKEVTDYWYIDLFIQQYRFQHFWEYQTNSVYGIILLNLKTSKKKSAIKSFTADNTSIRGHSSFIHWQKTSMAGLKNNQREAQHRSMSDQCQINVRSISELTDIRVCCPVLLHCYTTRIILLASSFVLVYLQSHILYYQRACWASIRDPDCVLKNTKRPARREPPLFRPTGCKIKAEVAREPAQR